MPSESPYPKLWPLRRRLGREPWGHPCDKGREPVTVRWPVWEREPVSEPPSVPPGLPYPAPRSWSLLPTGRVSLHLRTSR